MVVDTQFHKFYGRPFAQFIFYKNIEKRHLWVWTMGGWNSTLQAAKTSAVSTIDWMVETEQRQLWVRPSITCGAAHAGQIIFTTKRKRENSRVWPFEVRVMLLFDRSRAWMIIMGTQLRIAYGHTTNSGISQLAGVFCNKLTADAGWRRMRIYVG